MTWRPVVVCSRIGDMDNELASSPARIHDRYRRLVMFDLAEEFELGFFLSYYRNFAIPHLAATLAGTGEIEARPAKRSFDTAIVMYELIEHGFEGDRGRAMVDLLTRVHKGVPGSGEDFRYVLTTLLVVPIRFCDEFGRRATTAEEKQSAVDFYQELASRMGIEGLTNVYEDSETFLDEYEMRHARRSDAGDKLMTSTMGLFAERMPRVAERLIPQGLAFMIDDPRVASALNLPKPSRPLHGILRGALKARGMQLRRRPARVTSRFTPGKAGSSVYPGGYQLSDLGPINNAPQSR